MKVLLSIKPEYSEQIYSGQKRYEFRKSIFSKDVQTVVIYTTMPVGKVTGEFTVKTVHSGPPRDIWVLAREFAGVPWRFFFKYFHGRKQAYAIEVNEVTQYPEPLDLSEVMGAGSPPQSFRYL